MNIYYLSQKIINEINTNKDTVNLLRKKIHELKKDGKNPNKYIDIINNMIDNYEKTNRIYEIYNYRKKSNKPYNILNPIYNNYLRLNYPNLLNIKNNVINDICPRCGHSNIKKTRKNKICNNCFITIEKKTDEIHNKKNIYKRINNLFKIINKINNNNEMNMNTHDIDKIKKSIILSNIENPTPTDIKNVLKKMKMQKYYNFIPKIYSIINNIKIPTIKQNIRDIIQEDFEIAESVWYEIKPSEKKNLINYNYIIRKILELHNFKELCPFLIITNDSDKLFTFDNYWYKICEKTGWKYISSTFN